MMIRGLPGRSAVEHWPQPQDLKLHPDQGRLDLRLNGSASFRMTDWSFSQLCKLAGVSKDTVNRLAPKQLSVLDAAAQVLRKAARPMTSKLLIAAMAEQKLWTSPNGKTPHATLNAAMLREIGSKGSKARFKKVGRGLFACNVAGK